MAGINIRQRADTTPWWVYLLIVVYLLLLLVGANLVARLGDLPQENFEWRDWGGTVVDLTELPLDSVVAKLDAWDYFPEELLTPQTIGEREGIKPSSDYEYGTLRMRVQLPPGRTYVYYSAMMDYANRLFVNGEEVVAIGLPGVSEQESEPGLRPYSNALYTGDGQVEIILQCANYWGNPSTSAQIYLAEGALIHRMQVKMMFDKALGIGLMLCAFALLLGLFVFHPARRANLYFALACLVLALREGLTGNKPLYTFLPDMPWQAAIRLEYLCLTALMILLLTYVYTFFPKLVHKAVYAIVVAFMGAYSVMILVAPSKLLTSALWIVEYAIGVSLVYLLVRMVMRCRTWTFDQWVAASGVVVILIGGVLEMLYHQRIYLGIFNGAPTLRNAMLVFIVAQMVALFLQMLRTERDLAEVREMQQATAMQNATLQEMDRLRREFLANASHELKTPLTILSGYAQVSRHSLEEAEGDMALRNNMRMISSEADRLALMVGQLLDVIRIEENRMEWDTKEADIGPLIERTIETYYPILNDNHNTLHTTVEENLPAVEVDEDRIMQVLVNLIGNAVRHTRRGMITIAAQRDGERIAISVSDTGSGIAPEMLNHLFERWIGREEESDTQKDPHQKSTGLGLFISKRIVQAHGGSIHVESELGVGTTVTFYLPVKR